MPWFSILGIFYPLVFGLRRAYPFVLANTIGVGVAATSVFGVTSGLLRVPGADRRSVGRLHRRRTGRSHPSA